MPWNDFAQLGSSTGPRFQLTSLPGFNVLSRCSVVLILLLICLPPLHKLSRSILRPPVVFHVERGLEWVVLAQKNQQRVLTSLCSTSCFTVSIAFYISFLPLLFWGGEVQLASRLVALMSSCEYVGNGIKDLICAPRPCGHPRGAGKTKLLLSEKSGNKDAKVHALEYGLPSSHTMHALCLNFYIAHYYVSTGAISQQWAFVAYLAAALWVVWIGFSRVYMGMHTPIDIAGGAIIAIMVLSSYLTVDDKYEQWVLNDRLAFMKLLFFSALFLKLHPLPLKHTPSYENSVIFAGVALGSLAGSQVRGKNFSGPCLFKKWTGLLMLILRCTLGGILAGGALESSKRVAQYMLSPVYDACPLALRRFWRPPIHNMDAKSKFAAVGIPVDARDRAWDVVTTSRYVSYACLTLTVTGLCFPIFEWLRC